MQQTDSVTEWYLSNFREFEKGLNGEASTNVHKLRKEGIARFGELGFPTPRNEEWRFTNVAPIAKVNFTPVLSYAADGITMGDVERFFFDRLSAARLVFVNGIFSKEFSSVPPLPGNVLVGSLASALQSDPAGVGRHLAQLAPTDESGFTALSTAFLIDGAFIRLPDNADLEYPVHLLFVATGRTMPFIAQPRNLVVAGRNSHVSIVESYVAVNQNVYFTNAVTEMTIAEGAVVEHDKLQIESGNAFHVGTMHVQQGARSSLTSNSVALGGSLVRNNVTVAFGGTGSESTLNGLSVATGEQLVDNHTTIDHQAPHCTSHELYKSILDGRSRGVFSGKILVRKDAQKTDAKQTNRTLLLSDEATIDTKPQLEIFADDVKCTHGATVGQLDEEQVFYLRSRGIPLEAARDILTFAFAGDVINRIHVERLRAQLDGLLHGRLRQGRVAGEE